MSPQAEVGAEVRIFPEYIPQMHRISKIEDLLEKTCDATGTVGSCVGKIPIEHLIRPGIVRHLANPSWDYSDQAPQTDQGTVAALHPWDVLDWFLPGIAFVHKLFAKRDYGLSSWIKSLHEAYDRRLKEELQKIEEKYRKPYEKYLQVLAMEDEILRRAGYEPIYRMDERGKIVRTGVKKSKKREGEIPGIVYPPEGVIPIGRKPRDITEDFRNLLEACENYSPEVIKSALEAYATAVVGECVKDGLEITKAHNDFLKGKLQIGEGIYPLLKQIIEEYYKSRGE